MLFWNLLVHLCAYLYLEKSKSYKSWSNLVQLNVICPGSESNTSMLTFDGVDVMGKRLADEVCNAFFKKEKKT